MMKNGEVLVSVWENNREDGEDSATQVRRSRRRQESGEEPKHGGPFFRVPNVTCGARFRSSWCR